MPFTVAGGGIAGSGAANRIAYWSGASALTSNAGYTLTPGTSMSIADPLVLTGTTANPAGTSRFIGTGGGTGFDYNVPASAIHRFGANGSLAVTDSWGVSPTFTISGTFIFDGGSGGKIYSSGSQGLTMHWNAANLFTITTASFFYHGSAYRANVSSTGLLVGSNAGSVFSARNLESFDSSGNPQSRDTYTAGSVFVDRQCKSNGDLDLISSAAQPLYTLRGSGASPGAWIKIYNADPGLGLKKGAVYGAWSDGTHWTTLVGGHSGSASEGIQCLAYDVDSTTYRVMWRAQNHATSPVLELCPEGNIVQVTGPVSFTADTSVLSGASIGGANSGGVFIGLATGGAFTKAINGVGIQYQNATGCRFGPGAGVSRRLESLDTAGAQLRLTYTSASVYGDFDVNSSGNLTITMTGTGNITVAGNEGISFPKGGMSYLAASGNRPAGFGIFGDTNRNVNIFTGTTNPGYGIYGCYYDTDTGWEVGWQVLNVGAGIASKLSLMPASLGVVVCGADLNSASSVLNVGQATLGDPVFQLSSTSTNDDPLNRIYQNRVTTTDGTATVLHSFTTASDTAYLMIAKVTARRTGGTAGTAGDIAAYVINGAFKNVGGTVTQVGTTVKDAHESQAGWDCDFNISGTAVRVQVTGALDNNVTWHLSSLEVMPVAS